MRLNKQVIITFRVTKKEREQIKKNSDNLDLNISEFIRHKVLKAICRKKAI